MEWSRENLIMSRHFVTKSAFTGDFRRFPLLLLLLLSFSRLDHDDPFTRFYRCKERERERKNVEFDFVQCLLTLNIEGIESRVN